MRSTARKRAFLQERSNEQLFRMFVEGVQDYGIYFLSPEGKVMTWNRGAERIHGYSSKEILGTDFSALFTEEDRFEGKPRRELEEALSNERSEDLGWRSKKDGSRLWANTVINPIRDPSGNLLGFIKVTRDISEKKRVEELENALRMRDEFVSVASHELRTPLTAFILRLQLLHRYAEELARDCVAGRPGIVSDAQVQRMLEAVEDGERQARRLEELVDELLDVSRIRSRKLRLSVERVRIGPLIRSVVDAFAEERAPISVSGDLETEGEWDGKRLQQVLTNLVANAVKFGEGKAIRVNVSFESSADRLLVTVQDFGTGMDQETQSRIFEPFERGVRVEKMGGLGLGLYIARQIVEAHGGALTVRSAPEKGSVFTIELPRSARP